MKIFLKVVFWEYVQNAPIIAGFVWALDRWQNGRFLDACFFIVASSIIGAITIALTEANKVKGHKEPFAVLLANTIGISSIMLATNFYLLASWSNRVTDILIGAFGGVGLGIIQSLTAKEKIGIRHCIALGLASSLVLVFIHWLATNNWPTWLNIVFLTSVATIIISIIDYWPKKMKVASSP
jgi:hypothetical protein